jgi:O-acetyl-ADP-ribose deacetylase
MSTIDEFYNDKTIRLVEGDITERIVDVIVNSANSPLKDGAGVAGAIAKKGGSISWFSSAYDLRKIGPRMAEGNEDSKLRKAVQSSLKLAADHGLSISMPAASTGIFEFPKDRCAKILLGESKRFLECGMTSIQRIEFCKYDDETLGYFRSEF